MILDRLKGEFVTSCKSYRELLKQILSRRESGQQFQVVGGGVGIIQACAVGGVGSDLATNSAGNWLIVVPDQKQWRTWQQFIDEWTHHMREGVFTGTLPNQNLWGHERQINQRLVRRERIASLKHLASRDRPGILLTTISGLAQFTLPADLFNHTLFRIQVGAEYEFETILRNLMDLGYLEVHTVEEHGSYAVKGGLIDVFPADCREPVRIEFFGDTVDSIRSFHPTHQRSTKQLSEIKISPAFEGICKVDNRSSDAQRLYEALLEVKVDQYTREGLVTAFREGYQFAEWDMFLPLMRPGGHSAIDYLTKDDVILFSGGLSTSWNAYEDLLHKYETLYQRDAHAGKAVLPVTEHLLTREVAFGKFTKPFSVEFGNPVQRNHVEAVRLGSKFIVMQDQSDSNANSDFERTFQILKSRLATGESAIIVFSHDGQASRLTSLLLHRGISTNNLPVSLSEALAKGISLKPGAVYQASGYIEEALFLSEPNWLLLPEHQFFARKQRVDSSASSTLQTFLSSFKDLKLGDLVVHVQHGIGRYLGLQTLEISGVSGDYLVLEYASNDRVYLPVDKLGLLQRYHAGDGARPALDRLKSQSWQKRKGRVRKAVKDMAEQLLKVQARRKLQESYAYSSGGDDYEQFEASFPYEETPDQLRAIKEVNEDLSSLQAMDRLVCGDVGFGKTEVALRASYRVVLDHFQVIVLVPTTVLCFQHYRTFSSRLESYGVKVAQLNRFVSKKDQAGIVEDFAAGRVDILVGTHRLLSKDIKARRLGLLVIDEEQRFGVGHKEKLKEMSAGVDVLTLTATPIPRTLHMAMLGLRDISLITTPPPDRLSVRTYVTEFDEELLREAISQEIQRGGQAFFVHNRVEDIVEMTNFLKALVPHVRVEFAHGQMSEQQLEKAVMNFLDNRFDVLVCTTIIESGIDMPNVNTLIVNRADCFGLAQLYQLRGRVGRANRQAYAYFLTPAGDRLSDEGRKRLELLSTYQDLGSGFQIASHDLELRGAGNLLGAEQSGHAADVGLELYTEMLEAAISEIRGEGGYKERLDPEIKLSVSASIPVTYMANEGQRLHFYKQFFSARHADDITGLEKELLDRYGPLPLELQRLVSVANIKLSLIQIGAVSLSLVTKSSAEIRFGSLSEQQIDRMITTVMQQPKRYRLTPDYRLFIALPTKGKQGEGDGEAQILSELLGTLAPIVTSLATE